MGNVSRFGRARAAASRISAALLLASVGATSTAAPGLYRVVALPAPPGQVERLAATDLNNSGDVVGHFDLVTPEGRTEHSIVWRAATSHAPQVLPMGNALGAEAHAINDAGDIVGQIYADPHAVLWRGDAMIVLETPDTSHSDASDITSCGAILGNTAHPFAGTWDTIWDTPSSPRELRYDYVHGSFDFAIVRAINDAGVVAGAASTPAQPLRLVAFRQLPGHRVQMLGQLARIAGGSYYAWEINNAGQVVGDVMSPAGVGRAVLWSAQGFARDLGTLPGHEGGNYSAQHINETGVVTGWGGATGSFVWTAAGGMRDIIDLIDPRDPLYPLLASGASLFVDGINDDGMMIARFVSGVDAAPTPVLLVPPATFRMSVPHREPVCSS